MELRSGRITLKRKIVKDGKVVKVSNGVANQSRIKVKSSQDVNGVLDLKDVGPQVAMKPKVDVDMSVGRREIRERVSPNFKSEPEDGYQNCKLEPEDNSEPSSNRRFQDQGAIPDYLDFITLREIKNRNKLKKRGRNGCGNFGNMTLSNFEDDPELLEPICRLRCRKSIKKAKKRKVITNVACSSTEMSLAIVQSSFFPLGQVKIEASDSIYDEELPLCSFHPQDYSYYSSAMVCREQSETFYDWDRETNLMLFAATEHADDSVYSTDPPQCDDCYWEFQNASTGCTKVAGGDVHLASELPSVGACRGDSSKTMDGKDGAHDRVYETASNMVRDRVKEGDLCSEVKVDEPITCSGGSSETMDAKDGLHDRVYETSPNVVRDHMKADDFCSEVKVDEAIRCCGGSSETMDAKDRAHDRVYETSTNMVRNHIDDFCSEVKGSFGESITCSGDSSETIDAKDGAHDKVYETSLNMVRDHTQADDFRSEVNGVFRESITCAINQECYDHLNYPFCELPSPSNLSEGNLVDGEHDGLLDSFLDPGSSNTRTPFSFPPSRQSITDINSSDVLHIDEYEHEDKCRFRFGEDGQEISFNDETISSSPNESTSSRIVSLSSNLDVATAHPEAITNPFALSVADKGRICENDEPVTTDDTEDLYVSKMQFRSQRFLSNRKIISPTSQKRLQKAMEFSNLDDQEYYRYTRKMCYMNQMDSKIGAPEWRKQIKRSESPNSPKHYARRKLEDQKLTARKSILRKPFTSHVVPRLTTASTVETCSESAVLFSRHQMRDIETITSRLTRQLNCMKEIIEQTLSSDAHSRTSLTRSPDKVKLAVQNAARIEEGAKRWLSMMNRDCDRFCKIMTLAGKGESAPGNEVSKQRKVVFADEAGGKLCNVRFFVNDVNSHVDSEN